MRQQFTNTIFSGSRVLFWILAPILLGFAVLMPMLVTTWDAKRALGIVGIDLACLLLILTLFDPKRFKWATRILTGIVFGTYLCYMIEEFFLSGKPWFGGGGPGSATPINSVFGFLIIGLPSLWFTLFGRLTLLPEPPPVMVIDPHDPVWNAVVKRAQETVPAFREFLKAGGGEAGIKFPFVTDTDQTEHVWGAVQTYDDAAVHVQMVSLPISHEGKLPETISVPWDDLSDWCYQLPDGTLRGSFSTQAQLYVCRRDGQEIPDEVLEQEKQFMDKFDVGQFAVAQTQGGEDDVRTERSV